MAADGARRVRCVFDCGVVFHRGVEFRVFDVDKLFHLLLAIDLEYTLAVRRVMERDQDGTRACT